jgi:hypothetical protein
MMDRELAALEARLRRFTVSGDPSVVLDPAAFDEATRHRRRGRLLPTTVLAVRGNGPPRRGA